MARAGFLNFRNHQELLRQFILEIRQQPHLSIISMGMTDGEYFGGSRSPSGTNKRFGCFNHELETVEAWRYFPLTVADQHCIIEQGAIIYRADNQAFLSDVAVKDRYLGVGLV